MAEQKCNKLPTGKPNLTTEQVDRLLQSLKGSSNNNSTSLQGRPVLIPYGPCAFWEGELQPSAVDTNQDHGAEEASIATSSEGKKQPPRAADNEEVYVSVPVPDTTADPIPMSLTNAIAWLEKHSSNEQKKAKSNKPAPKRAPKPTQQASSIHDNHNDATATLFPMVDIQEEYTEDGQQVYGKAVDVSARLQHLWSKNQDNSGEEKVPHPDDVADGMNTGASAAPLQSENVVAETAAMDVEMQKPPISDEEYDQLTKRLEELELLEEQEQQRRKQPSPSSKKQSGLAFQKGFLNSKPKKKPKPKASSVEPSTTSAPALAPKSDAVTKKSKITIDLNQNTVQEIPREGHQQSLPPRQQSSLQPQQQRQTMMEANMFSGHIQERPTVATQNTATNQTPKKKRVSRFAQERMQQ